MRQVLYKIPVFVVVMAIALPSVGPLLDHHFAERQPGHIHVSAEGYQEHTHAYETDAHYHSADTDRYAGDYPIVLYNYESGLHAVTVVLFADSAIESFLRYEPTSVFVLPSSINALTKDAYISPPGKPPDHAI